MAFLFGGGQDITTTENKLSAINIQNSSQGIPVSIVYGMTRVTGNNIWYGDFTPIAHTTSTSTGKGGGSTVTNTTYTYTTGIMIAISEGPINGIGKVWSSKDITSLAALGLTQFIGDYTQAPWSYLTTYHPSDAYSYKGNSYVANSAFNLGSGGSLPNMSFEVQGLRYSPCISDITPRDVLFDLLPSSIYGANFPTAQIEGWRDFKNYCNAANILVSPAYTAQRSTADIVTEMALIGNSAPIWSEGMLKIVPYADVTVSYNQPTSDEDCTLQLITFIPNTTINYNLNEDDFITNAGEDPVKVTRKRQADSYNAVQIECLDRNNNYNIYVAEAKDQWNIDSYGLRPLSVVSAHAICLQNIGRDTAQRILQRALYIRNEYEFNLSWKYSRLEPMDLVSLTEPSLGLSFTPVRITSVEEDDTGNLKITAEDFLNGALTNGNYSTQTTNGYVVNYNVSAGNSSAPVIFQPPIALTVTPQIWIGAAGTANFGGAEIWVSNDNVTYSRQDIITASARYGVLTANLPVGTDPDVTNTLSVDLTVSLGNLLSATQAQADALATLSYVDGELISYQTANLTSAHNYNITYLRRGKKGTTSKAHLSGSTFMRLDDAVQKFNIDQSLVGTTLYIKLLTYNLTGGALQALSDVNPTTYTVQPIGLVIANGAVASVIPVGQYLYIAAGTQLSVVHRITINGRLIDFGRLIVN